MEQNSSSHIFILDTAAHWLGKRMREYSAPILASAIFGMLAYLFAFTNKLMNHDEVFCLFSKGATVDSGRWGLGLLDSVFPNYSMPWLYGILTLALMTAAICVILHLLSIRSRLLQVLLAGCVIVFPSLIGTFGYMFTSSAYALSFLLAVLAAWFLARPSRWYAIPALGCMVLSLSIYQSYVAVTASLLVLVLIHRLLRDEKAAAVLREGLYFVAFLLVSLGLYYLATGIVLRITGTQFNAYASDSVTFRLSELPERIGLAYSSFQRFFAEGYRGLIPTALSRLAHWVCLGGAGILLAVWCCLRKEKNVPRLLLLLFLIAIVPLAVNCMYLITTADSIHTLVLYGFVAVYLLAAILAEACLSLTAAGRMSALLRRTALNAVTLAMAVILVSNIYVANEAYLGMYLRYENAYAFYTALVSDIKLTPGFDENTKLAIIGHWEKPAYDVERFEFLKPLAGVQGFSPNSYSRQRFLEYYLGFSTSFATDEECREIQETPEFAEMAVYPYYGSMGMIGDILVVKLS